MQKITLDQYTFMFLKKIYSTINFGIRFSGLNKEQKKIVDEVILYTCINFEVLLISYDLGNCSYETSKKVSYSMYNSFSYYNEKLGLEKNLVLKKMEDCGNLGDKIGEILINSEMTERFTFEENVDEMGLQHFKFAIEYVLTQISLKNQKIYNRIVSYYKMMLKFVINDYLTISKQYIVE